MPSIYFFFLKKPLDDAEYREEGYKEPSTFYKRIKNFDFI